MVLSGKMLYFSNQHKVVVFLSMDMKTYGFQLQHRPCDYVSAAKSPFVEIGNTACPCFEFVVYVVHDTYEF